MTSLGTTCMGIFPFNKGYDPIFDSVVYPVIQSSTGLACHDARQYYEPSHVKLELIARMIEEARLMVVDISENNANVFFEFGIGYSLQKPTIILCSRNKYEKKTWKKKVPFDIQGRELLIYEDEQDLRLRLGRHALDALYDTTHASVAWRSKNGKNHVKSATSLEFVCDGEIWSSEPVHENFMIRYQVTINKCTNAKLDPDIRLLVARQDEDFPRVVTIFPWEHRQQVPDMWECHVDYCWADEAKEPNSNVRLQEIPMAPRRAQDITEGNPLVYDFFVTFCWPNMVVESTFFEKKQGLMVPLRQLQALGYPVHRGHFIGFAAINGLVQIDKISIKEIKLG